MRILLTTIEDHVYRGCPCAQKTGVLWLGEIGGQFRCNAKILPDLVKVDE